MRRAAGVVVLVLVGALGVPILTAAPVAAQSPTLTSNGANSGPPGTSVSYSYVWDDPTNCSPASDPATQVVLQWPDPPEQIGSVPVVFDGSGNCSGTVTGQVPLGAVPGTDTPSAVLEDASNVQVPNSLADGPDFTVTPASTPTPTPVRTPTPTPRPTPRPTPVPTSTPTSSPTPMPTPTPKPLPTPPPFIGGGGGGGSGGGPPEGGAACSGGIGRSPDPAERASALSRITSGADPTAIQIGLLASQEYYHDTGGNDLDYINRLYDDVLRHDPTPVEVSIALTILSGAGETGRALLAEDVVLSPEARAIRVDQAFHTLLGTFPSSAQIALWVNRLAVPGTSGNTMVADIAASAAFYSLAGSTEPAFMTRLYTDLLNRSPLTAELTADAALIAGITAGNPNARLAVAEKIVSSAEFRTDQVVSFYVNYLHPTCPDIAAQQCTTALGVPTASELAAALTALAGTSSEENIIAGVLGSDQYYQQHGSTQAGLVKAVYRDLLGREPTDAEMTAALDKYPNDSLGHTEFAQSMAESPVYKALVVSLAFQQLVLRAPLPAETVAGVGVLDGDIPSLETPDETLIEQIVATPEFLADTGGTPSRFVVHTVPIFLMRPATADEAAQYLGRPLPHDGSWQAGVVQTIVDDPAYRTDFVRGVYARFLTYTPCAAPATATTGNGGDTGFLKSVPGGWFGLGILVGVFVVGAAIAAFFTFERRRFARIYPEEPPRHHI